MSAASATVKFSPESTRAVTSAVCSGMSSKSQRRRQLVSRLGIVFPDVGFPAVAGCRCYIGSSIFGHFFVQKLSDVLDFSRWREEGIALSLFNCGRNTYFNVCFYAERNRTGQIKKYPVIRRDLNGLFYGHGDSIA